jgi:uncharacterized protein YjbI with pentapeptide repeats
MENSPGRDYSTVMEVLTAYVRENAPLAPRHSNGSSEAASMSNEATTEVDEGAEQAAPPEPSHPTADIRAILDVLSRTQAGVPDQQRRTRLELHEINLRGADLPKANLQAAKVTDHQLAVKKALQGAIMPEGQKYEEWLRDREGRGEDNKNVPQ